jgi:hypothetical protein
VIGFPHYFLQTAVSRERRKLVSEAVHQRGNRRSRITAEVA